MELKAIKLKDKQDIRNIGLEAADNGGAVLKYVIYTPSLKHSESVWDEHTEVFAAEEVETTCMNRIIELYKADLAAKAANKNSNGSSSPMAMKG